MSTKSGMKNKKQSKQVSASLALGMTQRYKAASVSRSSRDVLVSHTEMFSGVTTTQLPSGTQGAAGSSGILSFEIAPKNSAVFPWLSAMTDRYQMYEWIKLRFHYVPRCPATTGGMLVMAFDYDVLDPTSLYADFDGRSMLLSHEGSVSGPCWSSGTLDVPKSRLDLIKNRFTAVGEHSSGSDKRLSCAGNLFVGWFGCPGLVWLGDLEVEYTIKLLIPEIPSPVSDDVSESCVIYRTAKSVGVTQDDGICAASSIPSLTRGNGSSTYPAAWDFAYSASDTFSFAPGTDPVNTDPTKNTSGIAFLKDFEGTLEMTCPLQAGAIGQADTQAATRTYTTHVWDPVVKSWAQCSDNRLASAKVISAGQISPSGAPVTLQSPYLLFNAIGCFLKNSIYRFVQVDGPSAASLFLGSITATLLKRSYNNLLKSAGITEIRTGCVRGRSGVSPQDIRVCRVEGGRVHCLTHEDEFTKLSDTRVYWKPPSP